MSHGNARLTLHGRRLLVHRVRVERRPVAHVAKEMGISRQCAHRWVARYDAEGEAGTAPPLAERESGEAQPHPASRVGLPQPFTSNTDRAAALDPWLDHYNTRRAHTALGGHPPISRAPSPT